MREYTVKEIDEMRLLVCRMVSLEAASCAYTADDINRVAEDRLRTYLVAGIGRHDIQARMSERGQDAWASSRR